MSVFEAILLGIIQGLTEFLPISSTGHLTIAGKLLGLVNESNPEEWTAFIAVIQLGTLLAVLIYFWEEIVHITGSFLNENIQERKSYKNQSLDSRLGWLIIIGTIPVVIIGLAFKDVVEGALTKNLYLIAGSLIGLALILALAEKIANFRKDLKDITVLDSIIIGFAQALALIPGSSRSGTTITAGLFLGLNRHVAARFSFLLSIPAVFASGVFQLYEALPLLNNDMLVNLTVATLFSAISGYAAIDFLLKFLRKNSTLLFIIYRIVLGLLIIILLMSHILNP